jgi:hypothetical protein
MPVPIAPLQLLVRTVEEGPDPEDVVAGPWGAIMFAFLVVATVVICLSFLRQMRKVQRAREEGVFGDEDVPTPEDDLPTDPPGGTGTDGSGTGRTTTHGPDDRG